MEMFPERHTLSNGLEVELRPLVASDADVLHAFFMGLSDETRRHLRDNVTDAEVTRQWVREVDYDRILPILAFHDGRVIGVGTLHFHLRQWQRHIGEIRLTVAEAHRGLGVGTALLRGLVRIAASRGLQKCIAQVMEENTASLVIFRRLGFQIEAVLRDFAIDADGDYQDVIVLCNNPDNLRRQLENMDFETDRTNT